MIHVCTDPQRFLDMFSPEDRDAAQLDLAMFGMFTVDSDGDAARRVDPRLVRIQQQLRTDGLVSGIIEDRVMIVPAGRWSGKQTLLNSLHNISAAKIVRSSRITNSPWRFNDQSLPIWRKNDPGAT